MKSLLNLSILATICCLSALPAYARDQVVSCESCSMLATVVSVATADTSPQVQFADSCPGTITRNDVPGALTIELVLTGGADPLSCPANVVLTTQVANTLHTTNGSIMFTGASPGKLILISENGSISAAQGSNGDDLTIRANNGAITLSSMGGKFDIAGSNNIVSFNRIYGAALSTHIVNGKINATGLTLESKRTASLSVENGSVTVQGLAGGKLSKDKRRILAVKVRVIGRAINGKFHDRRPRQKRPLNAKQRREAAILRITTINGDITVR